VRLSWLVRILAHFPFPHKVRGGGAALRNVPLRDVATLMRETGMRRGEVFHLRKGDVDVSLGFVRIPGGKRIFARRNIPFTKRAISVLSRRMTEAKI
jgi:integrase